MEIISYPVCMGSDDVLSCRFNRFVLCTERHKCFRCGWNPKVEERRKAEIRAQIKAESGVK